MRTFRRILKWTLLTVLLVPALVFLYLCFRTVELPAWAKDRICRAASTESARLEVRRILFRLTKGVRVEGVRLRVDGETAAKASRIDVATDLLRLPWDWRKIVREVTVRDLDFPNLLPAPKGEKPVPEIPELPDMRRFRLRLMNANILGIRVRYAEAARVKVSPAGVKIDDARAIWPDADRPMKAVGEVDFSARERKLVASVRGQARQHNIRPLLETLDVPVALEYMDAFTGIIDPIDATYRIEADLTSGAVSMVLDLHPSFGAYRGIPLKDTQGRLEIAVRPPSALISANPDSDSANPVKSVAPASAKVRVGPINARMADGSALSGTLTIDASGRRTELTFDDVSSTLPLADALKIAEAVNPETLSFLKCQTAPELKLSGTLAVVSNALAECALEGSARIQRATVAGVSLANAGCTFTVGTNGVSVGSIRSESAHGGTLAGCADAKGDGSFSLDLQTSGLPLEDIADVFDVELGDRSGKIEGNVTLSGKTGDELEKSLSGRGHIKCEHGHLAQLNLFSGFTDYLVKHVPGVANLVQQSQGSLDFTIENGVFKTDNLLIEGDVFSIRAEGSYSIPADNLDFRVHVNLFRNDTILSRLTKPISWTFNKLLLEFKLSGPLESPQWHNDSLIGGIGK